MKQKDIIGLHVSSSVDKATATFSAKYNEYISGDIQKIYELHDNPEEKQYHYYFRETLNLIFFKRMSSI